MKTKGGREAVFAAAACAICALTLASAGFIRDSRGAQKSKSAEKKPKNRNLSWAPPNVDAPLRSEVLSSAPCVLAGTLKQAGAKANELVTNLENFTAQENIEYHALNSNGTLRETGAGAFDYVVIFEQGPRGTSVQESRSPARGSHAFAASARDVGLPDVALIFLPELQGDYEMNCEGTTEWDGQPARVVHFQQRKDRPSHTVSFRDKGGVYPAHLKGRAWIAAGSGEVMHLDTAMMEGIAAMHVLAWYLSIDYAPVQFRTQNVSIWLPRDVDSYCAFDEYRTITYHTFRNFMLFSVKTDQEVQKPQNQ